MVLARALVATASAMRSHASHSRAVHPLMQQWMGGTRLLGDLNGDDHITPRTPRSRSRSQPPAHTTMQPMSAAMVASPPRAHSGSCRRQPGRLSYRVSLSAPNGYQRSPPGHYAMITPIQGIGFHRFKYNSQDILSDYTSWRFERVAMHKLALLHFRSFISILV